MNDKEEPQAIPAVCDVPAGPAADAPCDGAAADGGGGDAGGCCCGGGE